MIQDHLKILWWLGIIFCHALLIKLVSELWEQRSYDEKGGMGSCLLL